LGLRKRRKKLTTLLTSIDRRLRSVESVTVPTRIARRTVTADNIQQGVVPSTDPKDGGATGSTSSDTTPVEFAIVTAATYSPKNVTGSADWMEVTTATDHNLAKGDKVTIYGLNNNLVSGNGTFTVTEVVSSTVFRYSPALNGFYQTAVTMAISATVSQRSRTTTTATLKLSSTTHGYSVGDVITVTDIPDQTDYNGTFFIKTVSGDTITYDFATALASSEAITTSTGTTHSVIHKYAIIGDTWIDTSVTPNTIKVWNGLIWTDTSNLPDGVIVDDHMAPAPPTGLSATQNGYYDASSGAAKIAVNLAWTAPTTNADGSTLRDLAGYKVFYRYTKGITDTGSAGSGATNTTTTNTDGTISGTFNWQTNDLGSSPVLTLSTDVGTVFPTTYTLSSTATSKSLQWTISGLSQDQQATLSWSTPSSGSGDITAAAGSTTVISHHEVTASNWRADVFGNTTITSSTQPTASDPVSGGPSTAATDWQAGPDTDQTTASIDGLSTASEIQFAVQAYDSSKKNFSAYSDALTVTTGSPALVLNPPSKPTASVRLGTVTIAWDGQDNSQKTPPSSLAHVEVHLGTTSGFTPGNTTYKDSIIYSPGVSGGYVVIDGLTYNSTWYAKLVAVSTNGVKTSGSTASDTFTITPLVDTDLIANTLTNWPFIGGVVSASALANGAVSARTFAQNAITSSNIANVITPGAISTGLIAANAIGADQIAAGSVIAGKIGANAVTASTITANAIVAGKIDANAVTADTINAGAIDGKIITGAVVQTAKPLSGGGQNARVVMDTAGLRAYNTSGTQTFSIVASTGVVTIGAYDTSIAAISNVANTANTTASAASTTANTANTTAGSIYSNIYYPGTTQINGGVIRTGTIEATSIVAGTLTGFTIQSASSGTRVLMSGSSLSFYNSSNDFGGSIVGSSYAGGAYPSIKVLPGDGSGAYIDASSYGVHIGTSSNYVDTAFGFTASATGTAFIWSDIYTEISSNQAVRVTALPGMTIDYGALTVNGNISSTNGRVAANYYSIWGTGTVIGTTGKMYPTSTTTTSAANVRQSADGAELMRSTSARKYKLDIKDLDYGLKALDLTPRTWIDLNEYNANNESSDGLRRVPGFVAEEVEEAGLSDLVIYDDSGEVEGLSYDRMLVAIIPVIKNYQQRISALELEIKEIKGN
jgi:hypothetical protein